MAARIDCPHCGSRSLHEFVYGEMPRVPSGIHGADARDLDRAFMRDNASGEVREAWFHSFGCRRWVIVVRDTRGDEIVEVSRRS